MKNTLASVILGVVVAQYGLTGFSASPNDYESHETSSIAQPPEAMEADSIVPYNVSVSEREREVGGPESLEAKGLDMAGVNVSNQAWPTGQNPESYGPPPGMVVASQAPIGHDLETGITELDKSMRRLPGYTAQMAQQVEKHGIRALVYENPEMKRVGREIGEGIGGGVRSLAIALGKDLVHSARNSGLNR